MADIRINALATTAASTASDDFVAVDGSANGTRKLNAYSPTFGGNLTVSGTGTSSFAGPLTISGLSSGVLKITNNGFSGNWAVLTGDSSLGATTYALAIDYGSSNATKLNAPSGGSVVLSIANSAGISLDSTRNTTLSGNLTVSGGTITGGTSGLSLASGGTNQNITLTPSGTGATILAGSNSAATFGGSTAVSIIRNTNATAGAFNTLFFVNKDNFGSAIIATKQTNNGNNGDNLHFVTKQNPGASWNTGMVLTTNDNLLIGTTIDGGQKLQVSGTAIVSSTTASTSTSSGALVVSGGVGVAGNINGGAAILAQGALSSIPSVSYLATELSSGQGYITCYNGLGSAFLTLNYRASQHNFTSNGTVAVQSTTASTSTSSGALVVSGGVGVAGAVNVGGSIAIGNTVQTAAAVVSTHKVTISIGGSTYYLLATNV